MSSIRSASSRTSISMSSSRAVPGVEVIDQTSWRCDEDRPALTQGLALPFLRHTADHHRGAHPGLAAERIDRLRDLHRELPRGREHQRAGAGLSGQPLEHRQEDTPRSFRSRWRRTR